MTYSVITTPEGKFRIIHSRIPMVGNWTYDTEQDAHRIIREMVLDEAWARREEAAADLAWDRYEREYGDD